MTILPLVARELRVRARSPAGYWTRFAAALAGTFLCVSMLTMFPNQALMGTVAFDGLIAAAFILCCFSGFLTVDGISRERREGTLGLLFLTRIRALDVLLGNFGAAGIASLCALAAFVPVLIVPVLAGGLSGGEATRKVFALFDTMILSLAVGLWASARERAWWSSARSAAALLILVTFAPPLLGSLFPRSPRSSLWWPGPLSALWAADDLSYRKSAAPYWISIAAIHAISWLLMIGAGIRLRRALREDDEVPADSDRAVPGSAPFAGDARTPGFTLANLQIKFPGRRPFAEGESPLEWLVRRQRGIKAVVWAGVILRASDYAPFLLFTLSSRRFWSGYSFWGMGLAFSVVRGCLFAWAASRFFIEARRTGELELLMTTPEGAGTIIASQWKWLKQVFRWPLVSLLVPWGLLNLLSSVRFLREYTAYYFLSQSIYCMNILAGIVAILWAGMWFGWCERSQARAIIRTVLVAQAAPFLIGMLGSRVISLFTSLSVAFNPSNPWHMLARLIPQLANLLFFLWLIRWARRRLAGEVGLVGRSRVERPLVRK
jgi:hypothetical protein